MPCFYPFDSATVSLAAAVLAISPRGADVFSMATTDVQTKQSEKNRCESKRNKSEWMERSWKLDVPGIRGVPRFSRARDIVLRPPCVLSTNGLSPLISHLSSQPTKRSTIRTLFPPSRCSYFVVKKQDTF